MKWQSMKAAYELAQSKESDNSSSEPEPEEWTCPHCGLINTKSKCQYCVKGERK